MTFRRTSKLHLAVDTYRAMLDRQVDGVLVSGKIPMDWNLEDLVEALQDLELYSSGPDADRRVEFQPPIATDAPFYFKFGDIFKNKSRLFKSPNSFYIAETDFLYEGLRETASPAVQNYLDAATLSQLLKECAHHTLQETSGPWKIIFLGSKKVEILVQYGEHSIMAMGKLDRFTFDFVRSTTHHDQKITIIQTVLSEMFPGSEPVYLSELIKNFGDFFCRVESAYRLYVSEFSFQKIRASVETEKLELTLKLNKVFSDIQNQLLAVPAALLLVGGQMDPSETATLKNVLIWFGAIIFAVLMNLLVRNQRNSLSAVKHEIDNQWNKIESDHRAVANKFAVFYRELKARFNQQRLLLSIVDGLVALSVGVATALLLWYSFTVEIALQVLTKGTVFGGGAYLLILLALYGRKEQMARRHAIEDAGKEGDPVE